MDSKKAINLIDAFEHQVDINTYGSISGGNPGNYEELFQAWKALFVALTGKEPTAKELLLANHTEKAVEAGLME